MSPIPAVPGYLEPIDTRCPVCHADPGSRCTDPGRCGTRRAELASLLEDFGIRERGPAAQAHGLLEHAAQDDDPLVLFQFGAPGGGPCSVFRRSSSLPRRNTEHFQVPEPLAPEQVHRSPWLTLPEPPPDTGFHAGVHEAGRWVATHIPAVARAAAVIMAHAHHRYPGPDGVPDRMRMLGRELSFLHDASGKSAAVALFWMGSGLMYGVPLTWTPDGRSGVDGAFETFPGELPRSVMMGYRATGLTYLWPYLGGTAEQV